MDDKMIKLEEKEIRKKIESEILFDRFKNAIDKSKMAVISEKKYLDFNTRFDIIIPIIEYMNVKRDSIKWETHNEEIKNNNEITKHYKYTKNGNVDKRSLSTPDLFIANDETEKPLVVIECKNSLENLDCFLYQIEESFLSCETATLGILCNASELRFYKKNTKKNQIILFWVLNLQEMDSIDVDGIKKCSNNSKNILECLDMAMKLERKRYLKKILLGNNPILLNFLKNEIDKFYNENNDIHMYSSIREVSNILHSLINSNVFDIL